MGFLFNRRLKREKKKEWQRLCQIRCESYTNVKEPLVLISQIQRSGGTLLSQLFDSHPQIHAHPNELYIGYPEKTTWPVINLKDRPESWFHTLFENPSIKAFNDGYSKYGKGADDTFDRFPFIFLSSLQKRYFLIAFQKNQSDPRGMFLIVI